MFKTIVCGVDGSDAASSVAETALWLSSSLGARLVLVHVVEEPPRDPELLVATMRVQLGLTRDDDLRLLEGSASEGLLEAAGEEAADLLIVGSRGRGSLRSALLGSVSRTLATRARCPVMIVPPSPSARAGAPGGDATDPSVVCGVDGSDHALAAVRLGGNLAALLGYRLVIVHALPDLRAVTSYPGGRTTAPALSGQPDSRQRQAEQIVEDASRAVNVDAKLVVEPGRPWEVLDSVANQEGGRLIVVAARGLSALRATLFGSAAAEIASSSRLPVLVLPEAAEVVAGTRSDV